MPRFFFIQRKYGVPGFILQNALLAPTAMNQQKFRFSLDGRTVHAEAGNGFYTKIDLGIAKYHFEVGAGKENFEWA